MKVETVLELIINWDGKQEITNPTLKHIAEVYKSYMDGSNLWFDFDPVIYDNVDEVDTSGVMKAAIDTEYDDDEIKE